jgi:HEPN domain-containing protein
MKQPLDLARRFLELAKRDLKTAQLLAASEDSDSQAIGFHSQQSAEKSLKAVLSLHEVEFRKTHDLVELVDLLRDANKPIPQRIDSLADLNPFAVTMRYDLFEIESPDRQQMIATAEAVYIWAEQELSRKPDSSEL